MLRYYGAARLVAPTVIPRRHYADSRALGRGFGGHSLQTFSRHVERRHREVVLHRVVVGTIYAERGVTAMDHYVLQLHGPPCGDPAVGQRVEQRGVALRD